VDNIALAHAVFDAAAAGDSVRFLSYFTPNAVVWHNFDLVEQPIRDAAAALSAMRPYVTSLTYEDRRYMPAPGGAVLQHVSRVALKNGRTVDVHTMLRMYVSEGRVARLEEYFDSKAAGALALQ
jgi:uncharacterized protein